MNRAPTRTPASTGRDSGRSSAYERVYDSRRDSNAQPSPSRGATPSGADAAAATGRARYDRFTRTGKDSGTTRYVRVDGDRTSPVVDLTGAAAPKRPRTVVPRLVGTNTLSERRTGSARFSPRSADSSSGRRPNQATRVRTRSLTRDSVLERYRGPRKEASGTAQRSRGSALNDKQGRSAKTLGNRARQRIDKRDLGPNKQREAAQNPRGKAAKVKQDRVRATRSIGTLNKKDPKLAAKIDKAAARSARLTGVALRTSIGASLAFAGGGVGFGYYDNDFASPGIQIGLGYTNYGHYNWFSYCNWSFGFALNNCYPWGGYYSPYWYGSPYCSPFWFGYRSRYYGGLPYFYSAAYSSRYYDDYDYEEGYDAGFDRGFDRGLESGGGYGQTVQAGEGVIQNGGEIVEPGRVAVGAPPTSTSIQNEALSRAAAHYLTVGDRAFQEKRYGDAVHFYAKAIEFAPDEGVLYLILSDALFATGDYHYAAYALRKALELDPTLTDSIADKHVFYSEPVEFDRQLAVLELFLQDHYVDDDARLVLAANYLFGNRPAAAVDLLESPFSKAVLATPTGQILLSAAKSIQYGTPNEE